MQNWDVVVHDLLLARRIDGNVSVMVAVGVDCVVGDGDVSDPVGSLGTDMEA